MMAFSGGAGVQPAKTKSTITNQFLIRTVFLLIVETGFLFGVRNPNTRSIATALSSKSPAAYYARTARGRPLSVMKVARVETGDSGTETFSTTRKSAVIDLGLISHRT